MNLQGRSFLTLKDFTPEEITGMIDRAAYLKELKKSRYKAIQKKLGLTTVKTRALL